MQTATVLSALLIIQQKAKCTCTSLFLLCPMPFYVYILYSGTMGRLYRGQTKDVQGRLGRHNRRMEASTASGAPWQLLWYTEEESRGSAQILEGKLKRLNRLRLLRLMQKYKEGIADEAAAARIESLLEGG